MYLANSFHTNFLLYKICIVVRIITFFLFSLLPLIPLFSSLDWSPRGNHSCLCRQGPAGAQLHRDCRLPLPNCNRQTLVYQLSLLLRPWSSISREGKLPPQTEGTSLWCACASAVHTCIMYNRRSIGGKLKRLFKEGGRWYFRELWYLLENTPSSMLIF